MCGGGKESQTDETQMICCSDEQTNVLYGGKVHVMETANLKRA
jgi:hypothetical protein